MSPPEKRSPEEEKTAELDEFLRSQGPAGLVTLAAMFGDLEGLQRLVAAGAPPLGLKSSMFPEGSALEMAIQNINDKSYAGCMEVVAWIASLDTSVVSLQSKSRALGAAAVLGNIDLVKVLLQNGADARDNEDYAFRRAAELGHLAVARWLHEAAGADVRAKEDYAIGLAAQNGHLEMCKWLVSHGADVKADDSYALTYASRFGHLELVRWLLARGADASASEGLGVRFAAGNGHLSVVQALVEAGATADLAMQEAAEGRHLEVCKWLQRQSPVKATTLDCEDNESNVFSFGVQKSLRYVHPLLAAGASVFLSKPRGYLRSLDEVHEGRGLFRMFMSTFRNIDALAAGFDITDGSTDMSDDAVSFHWPETAQDEPVMLYPPI